jgi:probable phosphoglycerate mutase
VAITTELVLARHGEANCNTTGIVGGEHGCTGLSPTGRAQVERLAARLAREHHARPFEAFYGTPRRRVRETIDIISGVLPIQAVIVDDLRGPDHGDADGRPWHEIKTVFAGPPQHNPDQPYATGSETWNQYLDRATAALRMILDRHAGQRVLVAAHGLLYNSQPPSDLGSGSSPTTPASTAGSNTSTGSTGTSGCSPRTTTPATSPISSRDRSRRAAPGHLPPTRRRTPRP